MLEVGNPVQLPLRRELSALQRARSLRDPPTTSSWKSPVLASSSLSNANWKSPVKGSSLRRLEADPEVREVDLRTEKLSDNCTRERTSRGASLKVYLRSEMVKSSDSKMSWDLGIDGFVEEDVREGDEAYDVLPRDVIFRNYEDGSQDEAIGSVYKDGEAPLHNRRRSDWTRDLKKRPSVVARGFRDRGHKRGDIVKRDRSLAHGADTYSLENYSEARRITRNDQQVIRDRIMSKTQIRNATKDNVSEQGAQILSPLILNSLDDVQNSGRSLSMFTLEEPPVEDNHQEGELRMGAAGQRQASYSFIGSKSYSPLPAREALKSGKRQSTNSSRKSQQTSMSPSNSSQGTGSMLHAWDANSIHLEDELDISDLPRNGCGLPCYWPKNQRRGRGLLDLAGRSLSCGLTDPARRKISNSNTISKFQSGSGRDAYLAGYTSDMQGFPFDSDAEALPLLKEVEASVGSDGGAASSDTDRLSSDLNGELGIEGIGTMNGSRVVESDVLSRGSLQLTLAGDRELALLEERPRSLSQKYRPKVFEELVGQNIVVQALTSAILKGKIAPVYLFQGSRGTGKTSTARIFAAALNCLASGDQRPCSLCRECVALISGKSSDVKEVDAATNNGIVKVKALLEVTISAPSRSRYKVFIIEECHMLTAETWNALLKILEEPPINVVFILITTDPDQLPRTAVSRCQKFPFPKIKDSEIVSRLQRLADSEKLEVEWEALYLIATRSDGSLRDAETTLDQLSLLGQKINLSAVHQLVGSVSDDRLIGLLDLALSADTVSTVRRARELVDSGVEPLALMSQLATLITDILAGSHKLTIDRQKGGFFHKHALSEGDMERLRIALRILSEADKQLRASSTDRITWLTAALLQFGPHRSFIYPASSAGTSVTQSPVALNNLNEIEVPDCEALPPKQPWDKEGRGGKRLHVISAKQDVANGKDSLYGVNMKPSNEVYGSAKNVGNATPRKMLEARIHPADQSPFNDAAGREASFARSPKSSQKDSSILSTSSLDDIWQRVLEGCRSLPLRQLLLSQGKLASISVSEVEAVIHLEFPHPDHKSRGERLRKSITNAFQSVLGFPVEVKISLASLPADGEDLKSGAMTPARQPNRTQSGIKANNDVDGILGRLQSDENVLESSSMHARRPSGATFRMTTKQANASCSFPAIPQVYHNIAPKEGHHVKPEVLSTVRSPSYPSGSGSRHPGQKIDTVVPEDERLEGAWVQEAGKYSPMLIFERGDLKSSIEQLNTITRQDVITEENMSDHMNGPPTKHDGHNDDCDIRFSSFRDYDNSVDLEEENLRLESRMKYGGLLCWKAPKLKEEKAKRRRRQRKSGFLVRLVPCAKGKKQ